MMDQHIVPGAGMPLLPGDRNARTPAMRRRAGVADGNPDWGALKRPIVVAGRIYSWARADLGRQWTWALAAANNPLPIARVRQLASWRWRAEVLIFRDRAPSIVRARTFGNICGAKLWASLTALGAEAGHACHFQE